MAALLSCLPPAMVLHAGRILLNKGPNASIVADEGVTALHISAHGEYNAVTKMLVEAGTDLEAATPPVTGGLNCCTGCGRRVSGVTDVLIEAGANPDSRKVDGTNTAVLGGSEWTGAAPCESKPADDLDES